MDMKNEEITLREYAAIQIAVGLCSAKDPAKSKYAAAQAVTRADDLLRALADVGAVKREINSDFLKRHPQVGPSITVPFPEVFPEPMGWK